MAHAEDVAGASTQHQLSRGDQGIPRVWAGGPAPSGDRLGRRVEKCKGVNKEPEPSTWRMRREPPLRCAAHAEDVAGARTNCR